MLNLRFVVSIIAFTLLTFISPTRAATETGIAPPADDETLIYVLVVGGSTGKGIWVAVNDQTITRVKGKQHTFVRAKAGRVTLNLAARGFVFASIALDDRPGETVYLKWKVGESQFIEVGTAEGLEFVQNSKRTKGIDAPLSNNEEIDALFNLTRLGFGLMRPASKVLGHDSAHGVVTIFRRNYGQKLELGVWGERDFVGALNINEGVRLRVPPGVYNFFSGDYIGNKLLKAEVEAGKEYFVLIEYGKYRKNIHFKPIRRKGASNLKKWLKAVSWMETNPDEITPRVRERKEIVTEAVRAAVERPNAENSNFHLLGRDHAYDNKLLKKHGIDQLITESYNRQIAKLKSSSSSINQGSNEIDVSGTYVSDRIGSTWTLKNKRRLHHCCPTLSLSP